MEGVVPQWIVPGTLDLGEAAGLGPAPSQVAVGSSSGVCIEAPCGPSGLGLVGRRECGALTAKYTHSSPVPRLL